MRRGWAILLALAACTPLPPLVSPESRTLTMRARELQPHVERVLGMRFPEPIRVRAVSLEELSEIVEVERNRLARMRGTEPAGPGLWAAFLLAKVGMFDGRIYVRSPEHPLARQRNAPPEARRDVLLLHEMIHVWQHAFRDPEFFLPADDRTREIRRAVSEGHAEYCARLVAEDLGLGEAFEEADPENAEELAADPWLPYIAPTWPYASSYRVGERFVAEVVNAVGLAEATRMVFAKPPVMYLELERPELYLERRREPSLDVRDRLAAWLDTEPDLQPLHSVRARLERGGVSVDGLLAASRFEPDFDTVIELVITDSPATARSLAAGLRAFRDDEFRFVREADTRRLVLGQRRVDGVLHREETDWSELQLLRERIDTAGPYVVRTEITHAWAHDDVLHRLARRAVDVVREPLPEDPRTWFDDPDPARRWRALDACSRIQPYAPDVHARLRAALEDPHVDVRLVATRALPDGANPEDPDWEIRVEAAGDDCEHVLDDPSPAARAQAHHTLDDETHWARALADESPAVRRTAFPEWCDIPERIPDEVLLQALAHDDVFVRHAIAEAIDLEDRPDLLRRALGDPARVVHEVALLTATLQDPALTPDFVPALLPLLDDKWTRADALHALGNTGTDDLAVHERIRAYLDDDDERVRAQAVRALVRLTDVPGLPAQIVRLLRAREE